MKNKRASRSHAKTGFFGGCLDCAGVCFKAFSGKLGFLEALNTAQACVLEKGRLQNTAPVHESGLRKCLDFVFSLGVDLGCFLSPFGLPLEALGETLGRPWGSLGYFWRLWQPWGALGCLWAPFWQTLSSLCASGGPF